MECFNYFLEFFFGGVYVHAIFDLIYVASEFMEGCQGLLAMPHVVV